MVGIEVHLSGNHTLNGKKFHDICDELQGKYPKEFKFTGWHPQCRCYATSILKTPEEIAEYNRRLLRGEPVSDDSVNAVRDVPPAFKQWLADNAERIASAKSLPYFLRDNGTMQDGAYQLNDFGTAQSGAVEPNAEQLNAAMIDKLQEQAQNGFLPKEAVEKLQQIATNGTQAEFDSRAALLQAVAERHASRTGKQIADIEQRWEERKEFNAARSQAEQLIHLAQGTNIDTTTLTRAVQQRNTARINLISGIVKRKLEHIKIVANNVLKVASEPEYNAIDVFRLKSLMSADELDYSAIQSATKRLERAISRMKRSLVEKAKSMMGDNPHPAVKQSYNTNQEVRKTIEAINSGLKDKWFPNGVGSLEEETDPGANGSANRLSGRIWLAKDRLANVKSALGKIGRKEPNTITSDEADAMATYWHEITHCRNVSKTSAGCEKSKSRRFMELANEFVSRKTLHEFYSALGCKDTPHKEYMNDRPSTGYNRMVKKYDNIISTLNLDADKVLATVKDNLYNGDYKKQKQGLIAGLKAGGIKKADGKQPTASEINTLVRMCEAEDYTPTSIQQWLQQNGFIK